MTVASELVDSSPLCNPGSSSLAQASSSPPPSFSREAADEEVAEPLLEEEVEVGLRPNTNAGTTGAEEEVEEGLRLRKMAGSSGVTEGGEGNMKDVSVGDRSVRKTFISHLADEHKAHARRTERRL